MKSIRLNDDIRWAIINAAIKDTRPELDYESVAKNERLFAATYGTLVYNHFYDAKTRRRLQAAPEGMVPVESSIRIKLIYTSNNVDPRYEDGRKAKTSYTLHVPLPKKMPMFYEHSTRFKEVRDTALGIKGQEMIDKYETTTDWKMRGVRREYEQELLKFLKQFTTTKQLVEAWPEGRGYLPQEEKKQTKALTIKSDAVNKLLGLPK